MTKSLIFGAALVDVLVQVPNVPASGSNVLGAARSANAGGCAINAYGALRYGGATGDLFIPVGRGMYADIIRTRLTEMGVEAYRVPGTLDNGWTFAMVEPNGERTFVVLPGVEQMWRLNWFDSLDMAGYGCIYLSGFQLSNPLVARDTVAAMKRRAPDSILLFDVAARIGSVDRALVHELLESGVMVHCNEIELDQVADGATFDERVAYLHNLTQQPVIVTLGERGTYYYVSATENGIVAPVPTTVVNTVGAGDTHCGAMLAGLAQGMSLKTAIELGNELAAKVVGMEAACLPIR